MYQVFFDQLPLYDPRDDELVLRSPDVHLAVGEAGEMSFTIDPGHPYASRLTRMKGTVELRAAGRPIFKGRIRKDTREFYLSRKIEVEGLLACLNDSLIPPFNFPDDFLGDAAYQAAAASGNVIAFLLGWMLDQHNSQVGAAQRILLGDVTVTDPNNYLSRSSSEYLTTMDAVRKKLESPLGGYLLPDYSGETTVLHYYADLPLTNAQTVEFGENLLSLTSILESADTYTAILPLGHEGLTLDELPDGEITPGIWKEGRLVYSKEAEDALGGRITRCIKWEGVTVAENLQTKARKLLVGEGVMSSHSINVTAADLGAVADLPRFSVGRYVQLNSTPHGFSAAYPLMELDPDILDPGDTKITMGSTVKTASDITHASQSATQERQDQLQIELGRQQERVTEVVQSVNIQITEAIQTAESIVFSALERYVETSNFEEFQQSVSSQFSVLAGEVSLEISKVTEHITDVDGDLQKTVEELSRHFDFGLDGLRIKAGENTMSLRLDHGLILFELNGQPFGRWDGVDFHTGNIVIDVSERAQFGDFAFVPRTNGSLSFLKVGG